MLNTHDLDTCEVGKKMPGIYLRDLDPDARPSERNNDLLLERASATVVKELGIGTDKGWQPAFPYQANTKGGILRSVFQAAYKDGASLSAENYGRWTTNSYCLAGDDRNAIAYSLPLILPDGTVYGVVGVERKRIEHERDHDILTGLYNRQAFNRVCTELFAAPERMGVAALMMMDLDNLKHINDTYGHDWGDQYIRRTGQCLRDNTPAGTVCARLSGDEFLVLFHGYRSRDAVREKIDRLTNAMQQSVALLPSGNALHISLSGGIAWYPDDGQDWETLKKYADFAMYQVKHADKGRVEEFDIGVYNREAYAERTRREFRQLLSNAQVFYCFQPIFSARSGRVVAYEALMRSDLPTLRSPATIMKLAREQGALYEIERITFTKALETFDSLCRAGSVSEEAMLFVNSIANTCLSHEDGKYINNHWHELCHRMVVEITEEEAIDYEALEKKRNAPGFSGMFALDDYGSGYSNENTLLQLAPRFVKVDITIIRGIDTSPDKQQILRNVVAYAHPRSMKIVAEGVETAAELRTVIELGADLLQGYFLARPAIVPGDIAPEAAAIIRELQRQKKD